MGYKELQFPKDSVFLVTGGAGFIGSNLCDALTEMGYQVRRKTGKYRFSGRQSRLYFYKRGYS